MFSYILLIGGFAERPAVPPPPQNPSAPARRARVAMALSKLSGDEQGLILGKLRNTLEPRLVMYFSSANKELRALLPPAVQQQLRTDYEEATALCVKMGMRDCKELREATRIEWWQRHLTAADLTTLAKLGSVLPAVEVLALYELSGSAGPDGVSRLAEGLVAGALPAVTCLFIDGMHAGDAGAAALAAALDRGALPRLEGLTLANAAVGDAGLAALAPALRRRPALEYLNIFGNPFGDDGLAALVPPPPPAGTPPPPAGGLKKLEELDLDTLISSDAGCATLAAALASGALPALKTLDLRYIRASDEAKAAVYEARAGLEEDSTDDEEEDEDEGEDEDDWGEEEWDEDEWDEGEFGEYEHEGG